MSILGTLGGLVESSPIGGLVSQAVGSTANFMITAVSSWILKSTAAALKQVADTIGAATSPNLTSTWFSSSYWRIAALAAMLTIPFLCAAAVQAVAHADLGLLLRAAFGYLPLSVIGVSLAAPLTMLLLAATDQMSAFVSGSAAMGGAQFLIHAATAAEALALTPGGSQFFAVFVGLLTIMAALALAVELLIREAAVYVVVLMLPLAFAALVWPARRVWAARMVELLVSLILSKFAIVAVLSLATGAFAAGTPGISELLVAMSLIVLSTFAPWSLMRILPFTEVGAGVAGMLHNDMAATHRQLSAHADRFAGSSLEPNSTLSTRLRTHADELAPVPGREADSGRASVAADPPGAANPPVAANPPGGADLAGGGDPAESRPVSTPAGPSAAAAAAAAEQDSRPAFVLPPDWRASMHPPLSASGLELHVPGESEPRPDDAD